MKHKATRTIALISFLIILAATMPLGYAYNWSPDMRLTWNMETDWNPSIAQTSDGKIWVVWHSYRTGDADIFYKFYDPSKVHPWSSEMRLTTNPNVDTSPSIMQANDGKIWVVWSTNRTGNDEIYYTTSSNNGATWSPDQNLTTNPNVDECPSIMQTASGTIWLAWSANRTEKYRIYYKTSSDNGATWSLDTLIPVVNLDVNHQNPSITQTADGKIWVVWVRDDDIFYKTYNGTHWSSSDSSLTQDAGTKPDLNPSITQTSDGKIWVVWDSRTAGGQGDIYYKIRTGFLWSMQTRLTSDQADDFAPSILQVTDGPIWIVWASSRAVSLDLYYKTTEILRPHDVATFSVIPTEATVNQGQPVSIEVVAQNHGTNEENVIVRCYANLTLIYESSEPIHLTAGELDREAFTWIASNTGTYKIWANVSAVDGETYTVDNTFPAILGDVNDDRTVNASDLSVFSQVYGSQPGYPNWNPDCNFDGNTKVDAYDLFDLGKNYGKSQ